MTSSACRRTTDRASDHREGLAAGGGLTPAALQLHFNVAARLVLRPPPLDTRRRVTIDRRRPGACVLDTAAAAAGRRRRSADRRRARTGGPPPARRAGHRHLHDRRRWTPDLLQRCRGGALGEAPRGGPGV